MPPEEKKFFTLDASISNSFAFNRNGSNLNSPDCLSAPNLHAGPQPGSSEVRIGHAQLEGHHGQCSYVESYYYRSRVHFDMSSLKDKEIVEAGLLIRKGDTVQLIPDGTLASFTPAALRFLSRELSESFTLFGPGETTKSTGSMWLKTGLLERLIRA